MKPCNRTISSMTKNYLPGLGHILSPNYNGGVTHDVVLDSAIHRGNNKRVPVLALVISASLIIGRQRKRLVCVTYLLDEPPTHEHGQLFLGLPLLLHHVLLYLHPRGDLHSSPHTSVGIGSHAG